MRPRAPRALGRKAAVKAVPLRVAAVVDGFLKVLPVEKPRPVREKVVRRLRALHPMD